MKVFKNFLVILLLICEPFFLCARKRKVAPFFELEDSYGRKHSLSQYKKKIIVLEWINFECPFVQKHYNSGHMQHLQETFRKKGVIWLSINSSGKGKEGYLKPQEINKKIHQYKATPTAYLIDTTGQVGKLYRAKATPHIFIINKKGSLVYQGGIDNNPSIWGRAPKGIRNFAIIVLESLLNNKKIPLDHAPVYGCSIKYE